MKTYPLLFRGALKLPQVIGSAVSVDGMWMPLAVILAESFVSLINMKYDIVFPTDQGRLLTLKWRQFPEMALSTSKFCF